MKEQPHICPLCGRAYDEPPALSRVDNQTDICPRCGMMEALAAMPRRETPQERARRAVYATGNRWAIENFEATHHYTFEHGVNILNLRRAGGVWELETVSAPFIKHSHKINLIHPQVSGEVEVSKVVSKTNDSGFIRTYIYF